MKIPKIPDNEDERLKALHEYSILETLPERDFDDITKIASEICQTPISLISLIDSDRQWFKSNRGIATRSTPRDYSFCAHAINSPNSILTVKDAREDERFANNPLVNGEPNVIFYAGVPLINGDGFSLGTLCVIDNKPRELTESQLDSLRALANQVVKLLGLKKAAKQLEETQREIHSRNMELEKFAYVISHDIKSPLNSIIALAGILKQNQQEKNNGNRDEIIDHISNSSLRLKSFIDGIISHYIGVNSKVLDRGEFNLNEILKEIVEGLDPQNEHEIIYRSEPTVITTNEIAIRQILTNLLSNGIKYNHSEKVKIQINVLVKENSYEFVIKDNGIGIDEKQCSEIFETFVTLGIKDRFNNSGTGIGLSTVKKLVEKLGGSIHVNSELGVGSEFRFTVLK